jgi:hypothetical protein
MDEFEKSRTVERIVLALERIGLELEKMNLDGITVWGGSTIEEN